MEPNGFLDHELDRNGECLVFRNAKKNGISPKKYWF